MTGENKQLAEDNKHIPTDTIKQDIADTKAEIEQFELEYQGYILIGDKMSMFKAMNWRIRIDERQVFIRKLEAILATRNADCTMSPDCPCKECRGQKEQESYWPPDRGR